ncbi:MAG: DUF4349 domain-containing protein [Armatimonadota bacterium]|nr:DUF4349 domain-containing protein [Armatimonadota bacterium]MDR7426398.1 DUF4349 domain-containing protein [Armatimonadota bacterium]MDR7463970.1 DUF4349 domain-containing protein [Armatimonadota bacterium]MDR7469529.1 DUF4349 domain-containing protein [Armatimonadota bacterium]MDR7473463.1 DUF4349 domain-containing protein [Armatimonadota bacterium]
MMEAHLPLERLSAYLDGRIDAAERREVGAHLEACAACRGALAGLRRTVALLGQMEAVRAPAGLRAAVRQQLEAEQSHPVRSRFRLSGVTAPGGALWRVGLVAAAAGLVALFAVNLWPDLLPARRQVAEERQGARPPLPVQAVERVGSSEGLGRTRQVGVPAVPLRGQVPEAPRLPFERQVVRQAELTVEVASFEDASASLVRIAEDSGGFVAESTTSQGEPPQGTFVLRVPARAFSRTLERVEALGQVRGRRVSGQDVTEEFVDLQARIRNLERHERQLLIFMERATRVADLLAIEQELSRVRGEIERLSGRLRFLAHRVELAALEVRLRQKPRGSSGIFWDFTASWRRMREAFLGTIRQLLAAAERLVVTLSALAPVLLVGLAGRGVVRRYQRRGASSL